jgi:hypothetical protein
MRLLVRHPDGSIEAAILIAVFGGTLRVSTPGADDAMEFRWAKSQWLAENGDAVELQFDAAPEAFQWCVRQSVWARQSDLRQRMRNSWAACWPAPAPTATVN